MTKLADTLSIVTHLTIRIIFVFAICLLVVPVNASSTIEITPAGIVAPESITTMLNDFQAKADTNGPGYANAFAFGNTLGYTIGRATIGTFPHFETGFSVNSGLTNLDYFDNKKSGKLPGLGLAPAFHFGVGLGGGLDFVGKFFTYTLDLYNPSKHMPAQFKLTKLTLYNIGGRLRYNWIGEKPLIPFLLSFGGLTFSMGGDMSRGFIGLGGTYKTTFNPITVSTAAPAPPA
ncbi:MAG TPA: hypothetical protein VF857_00485, partial [Spirochaetota bacterium]